MSILWTLLAENDDPSKLKERTEMDALKPDEHACKICGHDAP